jgi:serine/threonine protein kinase
MSTADSQIGRRLGPFVLEGRLGEHGSVYHAIHVEQRRSVAVKLLDPLPAPRERAVQEFARELLFLQTLQHPNVVPCFGGGVQELQPYLVMELVRGESLDVRLRRDGPLPWPTALAVARQVCAALSYGGDHRDLLHLRLSPSKILLGDDGIMRGIVKVADFRRPRGPIGLPAVELDEQLTTLRYQAPEQICGKPPVAPSTDVYALGCILFETLVGRPPFLADSSRELAQLQLTANPPRVVESLPDCPVWLDALVAQLLEKDPKRRPEFASAVSVAIEEIQHKVTTGASVAEHVLSGSASAIRPKQADSEARQLLPARKKARPQGPFYERLWFLGACLAALMLLVGWLAWPASDEQLLASAQALMAGEDRDAWRIARRDYLDPLLARSPQPVIAQQAQELIDRIEMAEAQERLQRNQQLNRSPSSPGEKLYVQARQFENFGDPATAVDRYQKLADTLAQSEKDRPFAKLAERRTREIRQQWPTLPSVNDTLQQKLEEADQLAKKGATPDARRLWGQIVNLYRDHADVEPLYERARERWLGLEKPEEQ